MTNTKLTIAANGDAVTTTIEEIHSDILIQALCHLDGQSLASASCATSQLRFVSSHPDLWRHLCLSTWPSLYHVRILPLVSSSPSRFFSDAFSFPASVSLGNDNDLPDELISAVDLYHRGIPIFSCVVETDTSSAWFRASPFLIDAQLEGSEISPEDLTLSWIVIDPSKKRAVNLSSRRAMEVRKRPWCVGETVARFTTVMDGWAVGPV
ncbi:probable F-box protein At2g36090, partial [Dendrobium catenatum]|uniref:probable F-box protein At2g36090 n=1 Tax=Dendrobium catenatum TaxID=906689 RepID=UPI00109F97FB